MKIFCVELEAIGGPPTQLAHFLLYLAQKQPAWKITVATVPNSVLHTYHFPQNIKIINISADFFTNVYPKSFRSRLAQLKMLINCFWQMIVSNPDLIYCNHYQWVLFCAPFAHIFQKKLVIHDRDIWTIDNFLLRSLLRAGHGTSHIAISEYVKEVFLDEYRIDPQKITLIYDGIDEKKFQPKKLSPRTRSSKKIIVTMSRIDVNRNLEEFIDSAAIICRKHPEVEFHHYGMREAASDKQYVAALIERASAAGVRQQVFFKPYLASSEVAEVFQKAFIHLIPSRKFALPNAGIESLLCGVPTVVTNGSGNIEVVHDDENGFAVAYPSAFFFSQAIEKYLTSPKTYRRHALQARSSVVKKFSMKKSYEKLMQHFIKVTSEAVPN